MLTFIQQQAAAPASGVQDSILFGSHQIERVDYRCKAGFIRPTLPPPQQMSGTVETVHSTDLLTNPVPGVTCGITDNLMLAGNLPCVSRRNIRETGGHHDKEEQEPHDEEADAEKNRVPPGTLVMHLCMACTGSSLARKTAANSACYASFAQKSKTGDHKAAISQLERSPYHRNNVPDMRHSVAFLQLLQRTVPS